MRALGKADIQEALEIIRLQYTNAYPIDEPRKEKILIDLWYNIFQEYPYEIFIQAVRESIKTSEFAPKPATIIKEIEKMQSTGDKNGAQLWEEMTDTFYEVRVYASMLMNTFKEDDGVRQCDKASAKLKEIYEGLDEATKQYVRSTSMLIQLARSDSEQLSIEKGRFLNALPAIRERNKTLNSMPQEVRLFFSDLNKQIGGGKELPRLSDKR